MSSLATRAGEHNSYQSQCNLIHSREEELDIFRAVFDVGALLHQLISIKVGVKVNRSGEMISWGRLGLILLVVSR